MSSIPYLCSLHEISQQLCTCKFLPNLINVMKKKLILVTDFEVCNFPEHLKKGSCPNLTKGEQCQFNKSSAARWRKLSYAWYYLTRGKVQSGLTLTTKCRTHWQSKQKGGQLTPTVKGIKAEPLEQKLETLEQRLEKGKSQKRCREKSQKSENKGQKESTTIIRKARTKVRKKKFRNAKTRLRMLEQRLERKKSQKRQRKRQKPFNQFGNMKVSNFSRENSKRYLFRLSPLENKHLEGMEKKEKSRLKEHYIQFPQRLNRDESGQYWKSLNSIISTVNSRYDEHSSHKLPNHNTQHYDLFLADRQTPKMRELL